MIAPLLGGMQASINRGAEEGDARPRNLMSFIETSSKARFNIKVNTTP